MIVNQQIPTQTIVREFELNQRHKMSKSTRRRLELAGAFPKRKKLSPTGRAVGWLLSEIEAWEKGIFEQDVNHADAE